jgi:hemerythrin-like domain-containing protein
MAEPQTIQLLRREHADLGRLLGVLERQINAFERAQQPDYDIVDAIAGYFLGYPERCHHPKEDAIYAKLKARDPEAAAKVGDLAGEHERLGALVHRFADAIHKVLSEAEISREAIDTVVREFIDAQRRHIEHEDRLFLPAAANALTDEDWAEIEARMADEKDPLFGGEVAADFAALHQDILRWEKEDREAGSGGD